MSKITLIPLTTLTNEQAALAALNANNATIQSAFDNTFSRDGTTPNQLTATADANSNRILNLPAPLSADEPLRLQDLNTFNGGGTIETIPAGGTTGQSLVKNSNTDFDVKWAAGSGTVTSVGLALPAEFTVTNSPVTTTGTLTATKATQSANTVYAGPTTGTAAAPTFRAAVAADLPTVTLSGDVSGSGSGGAITTTIGANKVTNAMHATQADSTIKSNISGGATVPSDNTITAVLDKQFGTAQGSVVYRGASSWSALTPGTSGNVLTSGGASANPSWTAVSGTGTVTSVATGGILTGGPVTTTGTLNVNATLNPCGRITFLSGSPVMNTTTSGATSIFYSPYVGNLVPIFDGSNFVPTAFTELSQLNTDTTKSPAAVANNSVYDLYVWNDAGTIRCTRGPAWTNDTSRSLGNARTNGILLNSTSITNGPAANRGTYVGTVRSNGTATFDYIFGTAASGGGAAFFGLWNQYNRIRVGTDVIDNGTGYTYTTATTRQARASTGNQVTLVNGGITESVEVLYMTRCTTTATTSANCTIGVNMDSTTAFSGQYGFLFNPSAAASIGVLTCNRQFNIAGGVHVFAPLELGDGANANTFNSTSLSTFSVMANL